MILNEIQIFQHKTKVESRIFEAMPVVHFTTKFYPTIILDNNNNKCLQIIRNIIPINLLLQLQKYINNLYVPITNTTSGKKATQTFALGYYMEQGGQQRIIRRELQQNGKLIENILVEIAIILEPYVALLDPDFYKLLLLLPEKYRLFKIFTTFFGNKQPPKKPHNDSKDLKWSCLFSFGTLTQTKFHLPLMNTVIHFQNGDAIFFNGKYLTHLVDNYIPVGLTRYTGIFTIHAHLYSSIMKLCK